MSMAFTLPILKCRVEVLRIAHNSVQLCTIMYNSAKYRECISRKRASRDGRSSRKIYWCLAIKCSKQDNFDDLLKLLTICRVIFYFFPINYQASLLRLEHRKKCT